MFITKKNKNCLRKTVPSIHKVNQSVVEETLAEEPIVVNETIEEPKEVKKKGGKSKKEALEEPVAPEIDNKVENI